VAGELHGVEAGARTRQGGAAGGNKMDVLGSLLRAFERVLSVGGIAGIVALVIAASICVRYAEHGPEDVPQVLTYSLTTIIGFYFGTGVVRHDQSKRPEGAKDDPC
jgi:hypothetical protein